MYRPTDDVRVMGSEFQFLHVSWGDGRQSLTVACTPSDGAPPLRFNKDGARSAADAFLHYLNELGAAGWTVQTYQPENTGAAQTTTATWARNGSTGFLPPSGVYFLVRSLVQAVPAPMQLVPSAARAEAAPVALHRWPSRSAVVARARWEAERQSAATSREMERVRAVLAKASAKLKELMTESNGDNVLPYQQA